MKPTGRLWQQENGTNQGAIFDGRFEREGGQTHTL